MGHKIMKFILYIKSLLVAIKYKFEIERIRYNKFPKILWMISIKDYIVFCPECGEYITNSGVCSNPFCPEEIKQ